jgi:SAM-dependent methyltransferase/predicted O-methyltransferase YrrM
MAMDVLDTSQRIDQERRARINAVWSVDAEQRAAVQGWYWMAHPMVRARINTLIAGDPDCDAYGRLERLYRERGWRLPIRDAISLGCGFGNLERDLVGRGLVQSIDAYDLAEGAIEQARRLASAGGFQGIRYHVADLDTLALPAVSADAVFAHQSVHHVERLEALYATVRDALRPGGVFHLHEFVGPSRFQWTDAQLRLVNGLLGELPARLRRLPSGAAKPAIGRPTVDDMIAADPTEAIRSADILAALDEYFEVIEARPIGGTLLHLALGDIAQNFDPDSPEDRRQMERCFAIEDRALAEGAITSDFVIITALPKGGPALSARTRQANGKTQVNGEAQENGNAMHRSFATTAALLFPPARRLYAAVQSLNASVSALAREQARLREQQDNLARELARVSPHQPKGTLAGPATGGAPLFVPPGHFYSPIVDPGELRAGGFQIRNSVQEFAIDCDMAGMAALFEQLAMFYSDIDFPEQPASTHRYHYENDFYPYGDAIILAAMMRHFRPRRIVEVGSGFSSAVMLDTLERAPSLSETRLTFIDPHDERLQTILRPDDISRATVIREPVQSVPFTVFEELATGDFLFLDTTHVAKTGSDVVYELFEVLPRLAPGVIIHFHDIFNGFEYPPAWIFDENRSWNEIYVMRAFLMYNRAFDILFFNDRFTRVCGELVGSAAASGWVT